jgi:hypothetical protein
MEIILSFSDFTAVILTAIFLGCMCGLFFAPVYAPSPYFAHPIVNIRQPLPPGTVLVYTGNSRMCPDGYVCAEWPN